MLRATAAVSSVGCAHTGRHGRRGPSKALALPGISGEQKSHFSNTAAADKKQRGVLACHTWQSWLILKRPSGHLP